MSKGTVNVVHLIGRLGADPEIRTTPSGATVANFNVATNRSYKDADGNWQEETDWHRIVLWRRQAEVAKEYARKGSRVYVEGRLQTRSWEDNDGNKRYTTEVIGFEFQLLDSPSNGQPEPESSPAEQPAPDDVPF